MDFSIIGTLTRLVYWQTHLPYAEMRALTLDRTPYGGKDYYDCSLTISNGIEHHFAITCAADGAHLA